jgi:hypothetical protein
MQKIRLKTVILRDSKVLCSSNVYRSYGGGCRWRSPDRSVSKRPTLFSNITDLRPDADFLLSAATMPGAYDQAQIGTAHDASKRERSPHPSFTAVEHSDACHAMHQRGHRSAGAHNRE